MTATRLQRPRVTRISLFRGDQWSLFVGPRKFDADRRRVALSTGGDVSRRASKLELHGDRVLSSVFLGQIQELNSRTMWGHVEDAAKPPRLAVGATESVEPEPIRGLSRLGPS